MFRSGRRGLLWTVSWIALFGIFFAWGFTLGITSAHAGLIVDSNLAYYSTSLATGSSASSSRLLGNISMGATFSTWYEVGWSVNLIDRSDNAGAGATTLSGSEMGPRLGVLFGNNQMFNLAVTWLALANGTYTPAGGSALSLQGMGYELEAGAALPLSKHFMLGLKLIYDAESYTKATASNNTTSNVSYSSSAFMPALYLSCRL